MPMVEQAEKFCTDILTNSRCKELPFHNYNHTVQVVNNVLKIGKGLSIKSAELEPVIIAAWFHDTGFCDAYDGHEPISISLAKEFLSKTGYPIDKIAVVTSCIEATKMTQNPANKYAEILCDADVLHIADNNFFYRKLLLRREWELVLDKYYSDKEWHELNYEFLKSHTFFTSYVRDSCAKGKLTNERKVNDILAFY